MSDRAARPRARQPTDFAGQPAVRKLQRLRCHPCSRLERSNSGFDSVPLLPRIVDAERGFGPHLKGVSNTNASAAEMPMGLNGEPFVFPSGSRL
jgi:hypothetical protein